MKLPMMIAIGLIVAGTLALAYGGFTYTTQEHTAELGSLVLSMDETSRVSIPVWAGVLTLITGGLLLAWPRSKL